MVRCGGPFGRRFGIIAATHSDIGGTQTAQTTPLDSRISRIGHEIYETQLREQVDTKENIGKLISIDINTGDYEIGEDLIPTVRLLRQRQPDAQVWTERIGYGAVYAVGGVLERVKS
jgi:hypothetical protein